MMLISEKHETGMISYKFLRGWGGGEMRVVRGRGVVRGGTSKEIYNLFGRVRLNCD